MKSICVFLCFFQMMWAEEKKEFVILGTRHDGMFSMFYDVILAMKIYEAGLYAGIEIDFGYPQENAVYFDQEHGPNWWTYYFEPIRYGDTSSPKKYVVGYLPHGVPWNLDSETLTAKENAHRLIQKYVRIQPHILEKVDAFVQMYFTSDFVIGVHYRGTDKEGPSEKMFMEIDRQIKQCDRSDYMIFVATDSQMFLDLMLKKYGDTVCFCDHVRSFNGTPIHLNPWTDKYRIGEEALIDCLLLSKGDILIRTDSNLSYCSTFFNPDVPEFFVN